MGGWSEGFFLLTHISWESSAGVPFMCRKDTESEAGMPVMGKGSVSVMERFKFPGVGNILPKYLRG